MTNLLIYTDGACSGNPGPGGWGAIVVTPEGQVKELGGKENPSTNNRMELLATIEALREINQLTETPVDFYTDSTYVIRGITQWVWGWKKRDWKNAEGKEVQNRDLWERLHKITLARGTAGKVNWLYSRGHVGTPGNERCDEIAVSFSKNKWVDLYEGSLLQYHVAVHDYPEETELPPMREKKAKVKAHSYLSYVHGEVQRHDDWASCERRVKGQSGAKFKKAVKASDELKIIEGWGLNSLSVIKD